MDIKHTGFRVALFVGALGLFGAGIRAEEKAERGTDRVEKGTVLSIDVARGVITQTPGNIETALADSNTFRLRRNETVRIDITRVNPLLFTYDAANVKSDTAEYAAALEFAKQLQVLLTLFPASGGSGIRAVTIQGLDLDRLKQDLETVRALFESLGADISASLGGPPQVDALKKKYSDADIDALARRIEAALSIITSIVNSCEQADGTLATDAGATVSCDGPLAIGQNVALTRSVAGYRARQAELRQLESEIAAATLKLEAAQAESAAAAKTKNKADITAKAAAVTNLQELVRGLQAVRLKRQAEVDAIRVELESSRSDSAMRPTFLEFVRRVESTGALVLRQLDTLKAVSVDVAALGTPRALITVPYSIQRQTVTITIGPQSKYEKFLDADARRKRDGQVKKVTVALEPYQPVHLALAPAFVLGFIANPEFSAVKDGDAFKIVKKESELTRYSAGIMLNITPDAWQQPTFGGHFQLGVSPVKDALGFFFGAGIKAQTLFSFGGGLMIQQVRKLGDGLALDTRLDDPAKLKLDKEFKRGFYLHVAVTIPK